MSKREDESDEEFQTRIFKRNSFVRTVSHWTLGGVIGTLSSLAVIMQATGFSLRDVGSWVAGECTAPSDIKEMRQDIRDIKRALHIDEYATSHTNHTSLVFSQVNTNKLDP